jgi:transcription termination/antitermination protein NusG
MVEEVITKKASEEYPDSDAVKPGELSTEIYVLRTTANREDQVADFIQSNVEKKKIAVYAIIRPHGMRGYIFLESKDKISAEESFMGVPYAKGLLPRTVPYTEIEPMLEQVKVQVNIQRGDIVEIISGPFKRENAKIVRVDEQKEEVVVELLETAIPIPLTLKLDAVKVIRRDDDDD